MQHKDLKNCASDAQAEPPSDEASPVMLTAATLFMMTRFAEQPDAANAASVIEHLEIVAEDERGDPLMREVCSALAQRWLGHAAPLCPSGSESQPFRH